MRREPVTEKLRDLPGYDLLVARPVDIRETGGLLDMPGHAVVIARRIHRGTTSECHSNDTL